MRYLAIDPGLVTGIACYDTNYEHAPYTQEVEGGIIGFVDWWFSYIETNRSPIWADHVVIEDWRVRANTHKLTPQPDPYLIIGFVQGLCHRYDTPLLKVGPSEHKKFNGKGKQSKVRRLGWGDSTVDGHDEDACSLLLHALRQQDRTRFAQLMKGITND